MKTCIEGGSTVGWFVYS